MKDGWLKSNWMKLLIGDLRYMYARISFVKVLQFCIQEKKCLVAFEDQENNTQKSYYVNIMIMHLSWHGTSDDIYVDRSAL